MRRALDRYEASRVRLGKARQRREGALVAMERAWSHLSMLREANEVCTSFYLRMSAAEARWSAALQSYMEADKEVIDAEIEEITASNALSNNFKRVIG